MKKVTRGVASAIEQPGTIGICSKCSALQLQDFQDQYIDLDPGEGLFYDKPGVCVTSLTAEIWMSQHAKIYGHSVDLRKGSMLGDEMKLRLILDRASPTKLVIEIRGKEGEP